ncbi:hypothetical protein KBC54_01720 [Patescibacteria group bacterium]|nr:hypothetical protein [Patescibacteria group bacterium]
MASPSLEHLSARHEQWLRLGLYLVQAVIVAGLTWRTTLAPQLSQSSVQSWQYVFNGIVACVLVIGLALRHSARGLWELIAALWIFPGVWFACLLVFPYDVAIGIASLITLCGLVIRVPAFQWMMCAIGVVGASINLGTGFPPDFLLLALVSWGAYDMLFPPIELGWIGKLPGTSYELPGRVKGPILMPADLVVPMSILAYAVAVKSYWAWCIGGGIAVAVFCVLLLPVSRRQFSVGILVVGAAVPFTILRLVGVL